MRYSLSPEAQQDLLDIRETYVAEAGARVARYVLGEITSALRLLADAPGIGHSRSDLTDEPVKFWAVFSYLIVYDPAMTPIGIARVLHGSRDLMSLFQANPPRAYGRPNDPQLPTVIEPGMIVPACPGRLVPHLVAVAGAQASWRYIDFFTANIRDPNTRRAYARACARFLAWCGERGRELGTIRPFDVATYIETLQQTHTAPTVKQQLAAIRMLFDWLVTGQVIALKPAAAVRGPKHVVKTGKTPVLEAGEWRKLLDSIPTETVRDLRDRALIATLTYSFARIGAALKMRVEDLRPKDAGWQIRLHEKGGKHHTMPCHHALAEALHVYTAAAGIAEDKKDVLFTQDLAMMARC